MGRRMGQASPRVMAETSPRILVVDNYDSFVYTLVGYLERMGANCSVVRNDEVPETATGEVDVCRWDGVLISPGPGSPLTAGRSLDAIRACAQHSVPMFGVCLGLQSLAHAFGATVTHAPQLMHGKTSHIVHTGESVFAGLDSPLEATRYHSLAAVPETIPPQLRVTAHAGDGSVQGLAHVSLPLHAVQFHPESVMTEGGYRMLAYFLELASVRASGGAVEDVSHASIAERARVRAGNLNPRVSHEARAATREA